MLSLLNRREKRLVLLGRKLGLEGIAGVIPKRPEAWKWFKTYTQDGEFTASENMWIRLYVIGNGGRGGRGGMGVKISSHYCSRGAGGGGGGTPGCAIHEIYLKKNETITISKTPERWQVQIGENIIYATHGGNGDTAAGKTEGAGGSGGSAVGGNVGNYNGHSGNNGIAGFDESLSGGGYDGMPGGDGGARAVEIKYIGTSGRGGKGGTSGTKEDYFGKPGDAGSGLSDSQETQLGAAGGGGGGIGWYGQSDFGTSSGLGGSGYTGGVVIESASV